MQNGVNVNSAGRVFDEADSVVADPQTQLASFSLKPLNIAIAGASEAIQRREYAHGRLAVDTSHIGARGWSKDNFLHAIGLLAANVIGIGAELGQ